jgi:hypothetical protein
VGHARPGNGGCQHADEVGQLLEISRLPPHGPLSPGLIVGKLHDAMKGHPSAHVRIDELEHDEVDNLLRLLHVGEMFLGREHFDPCRPQNTPLVSFEESEARA